MFLNGCNQFTFTPQMQHYRGDCYPAARRSGNCEAIMADTVRDDNIWRFRGQLISRTTDMIERIGLPPRLKATKSKI